MTVSFQIKQLLGNNGNKELKLQKLGQLQPQRLPVLGKPLTEQAYNRTA
jgi:hypothetical protein